MTQFVATRAPETYRTPMTQKQRTIFFLLLTPIVLFFTVQASWRTQESDDKSGEVTFSKASALVQSLEEKTYDAQVTLLLGILHYLEKNIHAIGASAQVIDEEVRRNIKDSLLQFPLESASWGSNATITSDDAMSRRVLIRQIILAEFLDRPELAWERRMQLSSLTPPEKYDGIEFVQILDKALGYRRLLSESAAHHSVSLSKRINSLTSAEHEFVQEQFEWAGRMLSFLSENDEIKRAELRQKLFAPIEYSFQKFVVGFFIIGSLAIVGLISFLTILYRFATNLVQFQYQNSGTLSFLGLEVFCLYLLYMLSGQKVVPFLVSHTPLNPISANVLYSMGALVVLIWPLYFGVRLSALKNAIGLKINSFSSAIADAALAPFYYLASWVVILSVLILYSIATTYYGIDVSQGSHPIVPFLAESPDRSILLPIVFLAVVIAPIVEEILFRGVLYSWLREHSGRFTAMLSSALIFAVVHPQGPVGIIPLAAIGFCLAFLREWKGSLIAPILVHAMVNAGTLTLVLFIFG